VALEGLLQGPVVSSDSGQTWADTCARLLTPLQKLGFSRPAAGTAAEYARDGRFQP
jgi:hypothetical protein